MNTSLPGYRSPLARCFPETIDKERVKRDGWREQGIVVVSADDQRLDMIEQAFLQQIGERLYGKREHTHG